ncbi:lymphocyte antigen 86 isoform 2-T2 [Glossophaga mutica]
MKGLAAAFLIWTLISPKGSGSQAWPTHTACKDGGLEVLYQSCDPLQDFGFSMDQCSQHLKSNLSIRFGMILREDIKELFLDVSLFSEGQSILSYSYPICEEDLPKFSFCGRKRGEQIYYAGPVNNPGFDIPKTAESTDATWACGGWAGFCWEQNRCGQPLDSFCSPTQAYAAATTHRQKDSSGEYRVLLKLYNKNNPMVACANATVICS